MTSAAALQLPSLLALKAELAKRSLRRFIDQAWHLVEPNQAFVANWHIDALCKLLEQVSKGEVTRLIVNVPPGCMKSLIVSVFWPAWEWATHPGLRFFTASYSDKLTVRDNLRFRDIVESPWYREHYGVEIRPDQNQKTRIETKATGWRIATSVGGSGTGEHPDRIIIDDPHTADEARSDAERQRGLDWFDRTISTRGMSRGSRIVLIMQRLHEDDLTGHLLQRGGWTHVKWPMRYEAGSADAYDRRQTAGELLWPSLFPEAAVRHLELDLGPYGSAGQLQQRPAPEGGGLFKREWFEIVDAVPAHAIRCRAWDVAGTENDGDWTVGAKMAKAGPIFYVEDIVRKQYSAGQVDRLMRQTAEMDGRSCSQREEQEPGSSGKAVIESHRQLMSGFDYRAKPSTGDKVTRARPYRSQCEGRNVKLVRGSWNAAYLDELDGFPFGKHDDQVDASSTAFNELALTNTSVVAAILPNIRGGRR